MKITKFAKRIGSSWATGWLLGLTTFWDSISVFVMSRGLPVVTFLALLYFNSLYDIAYAFKVKNYRQMQLL